MNLGNLLLMKRIGARDLGAATAVGVATVLAVVACAPAPMADAADSSGGPLGDPDAPGADCVGEPLDPTSVHLMFKAPGFSSSNYGVVIDLADPTRECVYREIDSRDTTSFFVTPDGFLARARFDGKGEVSLWEAHPDPLERLSNGKWRALLGSNDNERPLYGEFYPKSCGTAPPRFRVFSPTSELGFECQDVPQGLRAIVDGAPIAFYTQEVLAFFPDGRGLVRRGPGYSVDNLLDMSDAEEVPIAMGDSLGGRVQAARLLEGRVVVAVVADDGSSAKLGYVDDGVVRFYEHLAPFEGAVEEAALDGQGRILLVVRHGMDTADDRVQVLRLGTAGHDVLFDQPYSSSPDLEELPGSSPLRWFDRIIAPI